MNFNLPLNGREIDILCVNKHTHQLGEGRDKASLSLITRKMERQRDVFFPNYWGVELCPSVGGKREFAM